MTDQSDPSEGRRRPRRALRLGDSGAPIMTIVMLAVAGVAVLAGFVILRSITDPATGADDVVAGATSTTTTIAPTMSTFGLPSDTTTTTSTTTTAPRASKADAIVVVANASGLDGSATAMTSDLAADGYSTVPVANATGPRLEQSIVYYLDDDPGARGGSPARRADPDRQDAPDAQPATARPPAQRRHRGPAARPGRRRPSTRRAADRLNGRGHASSAASSVRVPIPASAGSADAR